MKNTTTLIIIFMLIITGGYFFLFKDKTISQDLKISGQEITLSMKNYNYYPNTIEVEAGKPVSITLDNSVSGCYRSFTIKDLGVAKYSTSPSDKITFTPNKKGTFHFACSMGMGYGTIIVR